MSSQAEDCKFRILVADDEQLMRSVIGGILTEAGYEVIEASTGEECIQLATFEKPDLVILDVIMPDIDGFQTCERMRNIDDICSIPVIFVSGLDNRFSILKALRVGATDYIIKPIEADDVLGRVSSLLAAKSLIHDKINLLRLNEAMVDQVKKFIDELSIISTVDNLKSDIADHSVTTFEHLNIVRECINNFDEDGALKAVTDAEMSLQFADRVSQQLNEFAKIVDQIHKMMVVEPEKSDGDQSSESLAKASSDSVLGAKASQAEVDDLLDSLGI
ncbi:MAG: response regulator [Gammaproteobacteria bacterium]|nr:MAG: response regulator [Gammaproteobacteria bacterium]